MALLLSIDVGTTSLKCVLFDAAGHAVASHSEEYTLQTPHPGWVEVDPEIYWTGAQRGIRSVLASAGVPPESIAAVGVTSQGETLIVLDAQGRPLRPAIVWLDGRSEVEAGQLGARFPIEEIFRRTGQPQVLPTWTATRIAWLRRHEPGVTAKASRYLLVGDYLLYRLTGRYVTDAALNPSTLYFDVASGQWWEGMLEELGIDAAQLPELVQSGEVAGAVHAEAAKATGLRRGLPVTTAPIDQIAGAVGAGNTDTGTVTECTGAALALCATVDAPVYDPSKQIGLYRHALRGRYVLMPWVPTAGLALRWLRDAFASGCSYDQLMGEAADVEPGAEGLLMLPHLAGAGTPAVDANAVGVFWGIHLGHRRPHFVRALIESVAYMLRENLDNLASLGAPIEEVRAFGGAARSNLWLQIKADVCRRDLVVMETDDATALGTAMIAAVACGLHPDLAAAQRAMAHTRKRVFHNVERSDKYAPFYERYRSLDRDARRMFAARPGSATGS